MYPSELTRTNYEILHFNLLCLKSKVKLMGSPFSLAVCSRSITSEPTGNFHDNKYGGYAIEGDLDAMSFNFAASTFPKLMTFRFLRWIQNLHDSAWNHGILYA